MKKFLFTLAALLSAGLFASAQVPGLGFSESEITVTPGSEAVTVKIMLTQDAGAEVQGGQLQWIMYNAAHEEISTGVTLEQTNIGTAFKPNWVTFVPGDIVSNMEISVSETIKGASYRVLLANGNGTPILMGNEYEMFSSTPGFEPCMWVIKIAADAEWADEFATLELASTEEFMNVWVSPAQVVTDDNNTMVLKIKNPNYVPAEDLDLTGEIIFGELDAATGQIPVSYEGPEEVVLTATINGEPVEIVDGMITLPGYGEYEVYVYANAEGYKEESRMKIFTWEEPVVEVTAAPVISVTEGEDAYIIEAVGDGEVILYCDGLEVPNPMTIERGDQDATFVFTATAQEEGKEISETTTLEVTVPAKEVIEPEVTATPVINFNEETLTLTVEGDGEIHVYIDGEEVEVPYTFEPGEEEVTYTITATAQEEGKEISETASLVVVIPAQEVKVYEIPMPVVTLTEGEDAYTITAVAGEGTLEGVVITLHVTTYDPETGAPTTAEYTDPAEVVIERTDADQYVSFWATATLEEAPEGYDDWTNNTTAAQQIIVPAKEEPQPVVTPTPEIVITETEDAIIIDVIGEGEIHVYVNGEEVEVPCTIEKGEEAQEIVVTATAQGEGMEISETAEQTVVVPAYVDDPEGHMTGYWVVLYDKDGNEVWMKLENLNPADPNQFLVNAALHYSQYGGRPLKPGETDEINPMVPFYFMIDGVRYACEGEMVEPVYGNANENPLFTTDNCWVVPVGYFYTIGVLVDPINGGLLLQISKGVYTGIDEMVEGKTVAGVRYFNMAGQEMQEANGICIAVTTYTDGTTSAVKVIK